MSVLGMYITLLDHSYEIPAMNLGYLCVDSTFRFTDGKREIHTCSQFSKYSLIKYISLRFLRCTRHGTKCGELGAEPDIRELTNCMRKFCYLAPDPAYSSAGGPKKTTGNFSHTEEIVHMLQLWEPPCTPLDITASCREKGIF